MKLFFEELEKRINEIPQSDDIILNKDEIYELLRELLFSEAGEN